VDALNRKVRFSLFGVVSVRCRAEVIITHASSELYACVRHGNACHQSGPSALLACSALGVFGTNSDTGVSRHCQGQTSQQHISACTLGYYTRKECEVSFKLHALQWLFDDVHP
jgi:hypothetical protein